MEVGRVDIRPLRKRVKQPDDPIIYDKTRYGLLVLGLVALYLGGRLL